MSSLGCNIGAQGAQDRLNISARFNNIGAQGVARLAAQGIEDVPTETAQGAREVANIGAQGAVDQANIL